MIEIDKTNKPHAFRELYQRANPLPGVRAKVPLLCVTFDREQDDELVLCESTVITEYLASLKNSNAKDKQAQFWPADPSERAKLRLFMELCGSSFSSYVAFSRVQNMQQVKEQHLKLRDEMSNVDAFLSSSLIRPNNRFTLAEAHLVPFVQRCCGILPPPYDPLSITDQFGLQTTQLWIQSLLRRKSVILTAPDDLSLKRAKLIKRLGRISQA